VHAGVHVVFGGFLLLLLARVHWADLVDRVADGHLGPQVAALHRKLLLFGLLELLPQQFAAGVVALAQVAVLGLLELE